MSVTPSSGVLAIFLTIAVLAGRREDPAGLPHDSHFRAFDRGHIFTLKQRRLHLFCMLYFRDVHCSRCTRVGSEVQEVRADLHNLLLAHQLIATLVSEIRGTWDPAVPKVNRRLSVTR